MKKLALSLVLTLSVTSCATYISGRTQEISVTSNPENAECTYSNERGSGNFKTPGKIAVERSKKTLSVTCNIPGYGSGTENIEPGANYWLLANVANMGLGYFYDVYDGSSWDYPKDIHVVVQPTGGVHEGNFMMKGYGTQAIQPVKNIPQVPQQPQQGQPQSQGQMMQEMMQMREMITSDEEPTYTPPSFDQQEQMQVQAQQQGYVQSQQQAAQPQYMQQQPVQKNQQQMSPYEIFKQQQQQMMQQQPQQYQQPYMAPRQ